MTSNELAIVSLKTYTLNGRFFVVSGKGNRIFIFKQGLGVNQPIRYKSCANAMLNQKGGIIYWLL